METGKNIMVCVTQQKTCQRLIKRGSELRNKYNGELFIIHVAKEGWHFLGKSEDGDALEFLFQKAKDYGANLTVVRSNDVLGTLENLVKKNKIDLIVLGESGENNESTNIVNNLGKQFQEEVKFEIMPANEKRKII